MAPVELHEVPSWKLTMYDERTLEPTCARPVTTLEPCRQTKSTSEFSVSFFGTSLQQKTNQAFSKDTLSTIIFYYTLTAPHSENQRPLFFAQTYLVTLQSLPFSNELFVAKAMKVKGPNEKWPFSSSDFTWILLQKAFSSKKMMLFK